MKQYYICLPNGGQYGPLDTDTILAQVQSGQLPRNAMVWAEGMDSWLPLEQVFPLPPVPNLPPVPAAMPAPVSAVQAPPATSAPISPKPSAAFQAAIHAAQQNDANACAQVAAYYAEGKEVSTNIELAYSWAQRAYALSPTQANADSVAQYKKIIDEHKPTTTDYVFTVIGAVISIVCLVNLDKVPAQAGMGFLLTVSITIRNIIKISDWKKYVNNQ